MKQAETHCAIIYDFDGTLAKGNCAEHGLMPALKIDNNNAFWEQVKHESIKHDGDEILTYLRLLAQKAMENNNEALTPQKLREYGATIPLFSGVESWFPRINAHAKENGIKLDHYIISSGIQEMIEGCAIGKNFKQIFACKFLYDPNSPIPAWPSQAINYTTKTQFLFRINKGIENSWDNDSINKFIEPELRPVPFKNMIFLGDGDTDIPAMKMVRYQGGHSIAVFDPEKWKISATQDKVSKLISEERPNYVVEANYNAGSQLDITVKGLLSLIKRKSVNY